MIHTLKDLQEEHVIIGDIQAIDSHEHAYAIEVQNVGPVFVFHFGHEVIVQTSKDVKSMTSIEAFNYLAALAYGNDDVDYTVNEISGEQLFYQ